MTVAELRDALADADPAAEVTAGGGAVLAVLVPVRAKTAVDIETDARRVVPVHDPLRAVKLITSPASEAARTALGQAG